MASTGIEAGKKLRLAVLVAAGIETLLWLYVIVLAAAHSPEPNKPMMIEAFAVTLVFIPTALPALVLGVWERWLVLAAVLAGIGGVIDIFLLYVQFVGI